MRRPRPNAARAVRSWLVTGVVLGGLAGCFTGERPTLGTSPTAAGTQTGDAPVDAVLALLDGVSSAVFTADYTATRRFGGVVTQVHVTQSAPDRRSVTIGAVRYVTEAGTSRTCRLEVGTCTDGIDPQPVSDTGVTPELVAGDVAKRLRRFAPARTSATTASQPVIAGQPATCVDLPLGNGVATFCALADGVLARLVDGDITVELTRYAPAADESLFSTTSTTATATTAPTSPVAPPPTSPATSPPTP